LLQQIDVVETAHQTRAKRVLAVENRNTSMQKHGVPNLPTGIKHAVDALLKKSHVEMLMLHITTVRGMDMMLNCGTSTSTTTKLHAITVKLRVMSMQIWNVERKYGVPVTNPFDNGQQQNPVVAKGALLFFSSFYP